MFANLFKQRAAGFTLVEAIVVLVVLGIVAALTLPRFINMGQDARLARVTDLYGTVRAAAQATYAASLVRGNSGSSGTVTTPAGTITTVYGYPDMSPSGIALAAGIDPTPYPGANGDGLLIRVAGGELTISPAAAAAAGGCRIVYAPPANPSASPTIALDAALESC